MEKSIETIWKEGFLESDALVAPKLNDLYSQKSKLIIDKLKRMFKINLYAIIVFAFATFIGYYFLGVPFAGSLIFLLLIGVALLSKKQGDTMEKMDNSLSSYEYLKSFDSWLKGVISKNIRIMRFFYPLVFLASMAPIWYALNNGDETRKIIENVPDIYMVFGIPVFWLLGVFLVGGLMALFGGAIYKWDLNIIYGRVFRKLDEIITDMEELRA